MLATQIGTLQVRAALALGRHAEVLAVVGRRRRDRRRLAQEEAEALLGLMRPRDALRVATRALQRGGLDGDAAARLHVIRARALWQMGAARRAGAEAARANASAASDGSRAHAQATLALFAWKENRPEQARDLSRLALALAEAAGDVLGVVRALEIEAGVLRDAGRFEEALRVHDRRVEIAATTTRVDEMGRARADRGDLMAFLGRWEDAVRDLDAAIDLFRRLGDEREHTLARPRRAMVDLARGELLAARRAVERARTCTFDAPRLRGEHHLLASDLELASGNVGAAEAEAREALQCLSGLGSREGSSRARVRLAHALVAGGRAPEGREQAARAVREAPPSRRDLRLLALLALGRAQLRLGEGAAALSFEAALGLGETRRGPVAAARLGLRVARGGSGADAGVAEALRELEAWGDRRLLAYALADVRERGGLPALPQAAVEAPAGAPGPAAACAEAALLAAAAEALLMAETWTGRFGGALAALRRELGFCRAAWVGPGALELRPDGTLDALAADDLARSVVATARGAARVALEGPFTRHPVRVLHDLREAVVVPAPGGAWLYADFKGDTPHGALARLAPVARLLAAAADGGIEAAPRGEDAFPEILGECEALRELRRTIGRVGRSSLAVHIFGETGTGKERVAEALHGASGRRGRLVCVNAAQLDDGLFESAMFGHVKGAFTGAASDAEGYVAAAQGGTLFLDEVAELSPRAQAKLLRFLETMEYTRLGDPRPRRADVRILSAANVRLREREQRFREDLIYRLADFTLTLPPLRERGDDVLVLARHFLRLHAAAEGVACPRLGLDAARALQSHSWPGNVRELVKEMHRAVVLASGGVVRAEQLQLRTEDVRGGARRTLREARANFEREMVARCLTAQGGCRVRTADALGITRQALAVKLRRFGLS